MIYGDKFFTRFDFVSLHLIIMQAANQMNQGKSIFAQVMSLFPEYIFRQWLQDTMATDIRSSSPAVTSSW